MSPSRIRLLAEWLETQRDFGDLVLPPDVSRTDLLDARRLLEQLRTGNTPPAASARQPATSTARKTPPSSAKARPPVHAAESKPKTPVTRTAPEPAMPATTPTWTSLDDMRAAICTCTNCALGHSRNEFVFGTGNPDADLVIVGEAPGAEEDRQGVPFVGRAGELLTRMVAALGFAREDIYICNILKCRPPNNRDPNAEEVAQCSPYLQAQLSLIRPKVILAVGRVAGKTLLGRESSLKDMRGQVHEVFGIPLRVSYHPAALLRNPHWKHPAWEDLKALLAHYRQLGGKPGSLPVKA